MEKIGNILKEKRLEKGFTIEQVSVKTRLTTKYIHAIEEGDISYFKDDLSYLRYFLRSYCDVLGLDFEEIKPLLQESINDYTQTFTIQAVKEHEQIEANIAKNSHHVSNPGHTLPKQNSKKHHKPDFSLITLVGIIAVIAVCLVLAVIYLFPQLNNDKNETPKNNDPVVEKPNPEKQPETSNEDEAKSKAPVLKTTTDLFHYEVSGIKVNEEVTVEITFKQNAWFALNLDNVQVNDPVAKVYNVNEAITYKTTVKAGTQIMLRFGYMVAHEIKINGVAVTLDPSTYASVNPTSIYFTMKGE